jgi:hypothetical protein
MVDLNYLEDYDLESYREDIVQAILNDEINPDMSTEDIENQVGYLFVYYFYNGNGQPEIEFDIPDTWQQWSTTFVELEQPILWETQLVGELRDREGVEMRTNQMMQLLRNQNVIGDYRIRRNYVRGMN